jgi:hypothetical protein
MVITLIMMYNIHVYVEKKSTAPVQPQPQKI